MILVERIDKLLLIYTFKIYGTNETYTLNSVFFSINQSGRKFCQYALGEQLVKKERCL